MDFVKKLTIMGPSLFLLCVNAMDPKMQKVILNTMQVFGLKSRILVKQQITR